MTADPATAHVFAYASLVSGDSAAETLGRDHVVLLPAVLSGWRRAYSLARDNRRCEKTFAGPGGEIPEVILGMNIEPDADSKVNGALIGVTADELERLGRRELRYDPIDVTAAVSTDEPAAGSAPIFTYVAKPANHAPRPPDGAVILASYERTVEAAFDELGPGQLDEFRRTTEVCPVPRIEGTLVADDIPTGNPRAW